jgi:hypothetical protein
MKIERFFIIISCLVLAMEASAEQPPRSAGEWRQDCRALVEALRGGEPGDDLDITYCVGQTEGIVAGLATGSRIGAVGMASRLTLAYGLDRAQVFEMFEKTSAEDLLGICLPADLRTGAQVLVVADFLDANPASAELPVTAVFFEALQARFPCAAEPDQ